MPERGEPERGEPARGEPAWGEPASGATTYLYRRGFNLPSGLTPSSRVLLRVDGWDGQLESITVNGSPLETLSAKIDADITDLLRPHNEILVRLSDAAAAPARMSGEVTLAIQEPECETAGDGAAP